MRAVVIREAGGPEVLEVRDVPRPEPSSGEVRVRVRATAVNRADILQRLGRYPAPAGWPADIPGIELAGEVDALGENVTSLRIGDRVFGLVGGGSYSEYVRVHERAIARLGDAMTFVEAAAVPEAFLVAWDALVTQAHLSAGETVLVHAVGGGVGTAAFQIAHAIGARAIGTSRTQEKLVRSRAVGLAQGICVEDGKFAQAVLSQTDGEGVDVILDLVGGPYVAQDLECIKTLGRIVVVGSMAGAEAKLDLGALLRKRVVIRGTVLRSRPLEEKIGLAQTLDRRIVPLFSQGRLRSVIDRVLKLEEAPQAHRLMQSNETFGKIVLEVS